MAEDEPDQGDLLRSLPATTARVIRFSAEIAESQPERPDYLHSVLCQVGLPRSRTKSTQFQRTNGNASLLVEAGSLWNGTEWIAQPLPYGTRPRLALVYVSSEAVRTKSPTVELGHSVRDFLIRIGVDTGGREYATFNAQMRALAACRMTLGFGAATIDAKPIKQFVAWTDSATSSQALAPGTIELSPEFFGSLAQSAVPLDARALSALQHSSLALDVYCWLAHRLHRVKRITGERLSWKNLREQFGQEYADPKNFKREMEKALRTVMAVYPDARIDQVEGGVVLLPSLPPVPKTMVQVRDRRS